MGADSEDGRKECIYSRTSSIKQITFPAYSFKGESHLRSVLSYHYERSNKKRSGSYGDKPHLVFDVPKQGLEFFFKLTSDP